MRPLNSKRKMDVLDVSHVLNMIRSGKIRSLVSTTKVLDLKKIKDLLDDKPMAPIVLASFLNESPTSHPFANMPTHGGVNNPLFLVDGYDTMDAILSIFAAELSHSGKFTRTGADGYPLIEFIEDGNISLILYIRDNLDLPGQNMMSGIVQDLFETNVVVMTYYLDTLADLKQIID